MRKRQYAPVGPVAVLADLAQRGEFGDYHLLLAHAVLMDPPAWRHLVATYRPDFVIMDNSLIELGESLPGTAILEAASIVQADAIVLPDKLLDMEATLEMAVRAYEELPHDGGVPDLMAVVQGESLPEVYQCAEWLVREINPAYLAIPRCLTDEVASRTVLARELYRRYQRPIHLLGFSHDVFDDVRAARCVGVMGIDSAMPIWYGNLGYDLPVSPLGDMREQIVPMRRPSDYWQHTHVSEQAYQNVRRVRSWLRNLEL